MIDPSFLKEVENLNLALKKHSSELEEGRQSGNGKGNGTVFADHKSYSPGDDIRKIDWKAYARTKDLYIKRFEEEKSITLHILVDRSSSMDYGDENKYDHASKIGLALAYMTSNTSDRFRFSVFSETLTEVSHGRRSLQVNGLLETINQLDKTPESRLDTCIQQYSDRIKHESYLVVISDFLVNREKIVDALHSLEDHNTILVNTLSPEELNPEQEGDTLFKHPEKSFKLRTYLTPRTKKKYREKLDSHIEMLKEEATKNQAKYIQVNTGDDPLDNFLKVWRELNR